MCIRRLLTCDRYLVARYWVSQALLTGALIYMAAGFLRAQGGVSQEYMNGVFRSELDALRRDMTEMRKDFDGMQNMQSTALVGIFVGVAVSMINLRQTRVAAKRRRAGDDGDAA